MLDFEGASYELNVRGSGVYREIIRRIIEQLHAGLEIHGRLMAFVFNLHSHAFQADNKEIRAFRKRIMTWIERVYKTGSIGFVWVRERETTKQQHYHFALWIEGNKIQHPKKLLNHIMKKWEEIDPSNHHLHICHNAFYFMDNKEDLIKPNSKTDRGLVYRLSYLAKVRGKGYRPEQSKDYSTSRLKLKGDDMKRRLEKLEATRPQQVQPTDTKAIIAEIKQRHAIGSSCYCVKCRGKVTGSDADKVVQRLRVKMFEREDASGGCYKQQYANHLAAYKNEVANG